MLFAVNRSLDSEIELDFVAQDFASSELIEHIELYCDDLKAINDKSTERVAAEKVKISKNGTVTLKKHSWNMLRFKI